MQNLSTFVGPKGLNYSERQRASNFSIVFLTPSYFLSLASFVLDANKTLKSCFAEVA
jgi:hypothetical protein